LPNCKVCGKRSSTTDKETAQIAWRIGRICQTCTKNLRFRQQYKAKFIEEKKESWIVRILKKIVGL